MAFPDIGTFPESDPGPYERQMGRMIAGLLAVFADRIPDSESNARVAELAGNPSRWSAGHAVFNEVRGRLLTAMATKERARGCQYILRSRVAKRYTMPLTRRIRSTLDHHSSSLHKHSGWRKWLDYQSRMLSPRWATDCSARVRNFTSTCAKQASAEFVTQLLLPDS